MIKKFQIGIDTGVKTGFACWDRSIRKLLLVTTVQIHQAMEAVRDMHKRHPGQVKVRIEDARKRKWIPEQKTARAEAGMREGAGSIKRDAKIWEDFCTDHGIEFDLVAPKDNKTKWKAEHFNRVTGWTKPTNEHGRDAAMLVYGI